MGNKTRETVITINDVSKSFVLPHEKKTSVKSNFTSLFRKSGKNTKQTALKNINLEIQKGEFFGIVGRNGGGKSTLLKIIAGIYQPTRGSVSVKGRLVPFIELGVGFNPELTGRENVFLNGAILGFERKEIEHNYPKIVEFAELEDFMDQKLKNYSSGMQVRLAFACATLAEADILVVDEVLAVGDADFQRKCYDYFKALKRAGVTVVFVTHDMNAVREYCDRAVLIEDTVIKDVGTAEAISDNYLQLFNGTDAFSGEENEGRWGTGELQMIDIRLRATQEHINFDLDVLANSDHEKFIIGYNFKNQDGTPIMGGNSMNVVEAVGRARIQKGQIKTVSFVTPNFLGSGEYTLELALKAENGIILDKRPNAGKIKVAKTESYYPTIGLAKMTIRTAKE